MTAAEALTPDALVRLAAGRCPRHPDPHLYGELPQLRAALAGAPAEPADLLGAFLDRAVGPGCHAYPPVAVSTGAVAGVAPATGTGLPVHRRLKVLAGAA
ncbi:hypothetical protein [Streptomyces sp. NRRL S-87]|uniref:hypothetical protein n=1 Tax=Streptomyces sp. NRRL S-87 TaxID=1463920 RepID=UPI0004C0F464|nr:hypothetical protein [Streptomyces sp. NRRL S-87]